MSVLMIPYDDVPQEEARRDLDEDVVDPLARLPGLLPVLQPGLVAGGLYDLLVALPQLLDVVALSLQSKVRHVLSQVQMVHGGSLFINRYLGRYGSTTTLLLTIDQSEPLSRLECVFDVLTVTGLTELTGASKRRSDIVNY